MISYQKSIDNIVEFSHINFDKENIIAESEYYNLPIQSIAQEVADQLAFKWNRMSRDDPKFNEYQDRLHTLLAWIK